MKLFKIWQEVNDNYDTYDSAIVAAESEEEARKSPVDVYYEWDDSENSWMFKYRDGSRKKENNYYWAHPDDIKVEYIGEAKEGTEKGVILASFNAG